MTNYVAGRDMWLLDRSVRKGDPVPADVIAMLDIEQSMAVGALVEVKEPEPESTPEPPVEAQPDAPTELAPGADIAPEDEPVPEAAPAGGEPLPEPQSE